MSEQEIKLNCLGMASKINPNATTEDLIKSAEVLFAFIKGA